MKELTTYVIPGNNITINCFVCSLTGYIHSHHNHRLWQLTFYAYTAKCSETPREVLVRSKVFSAAWTTGHKWCDFLLLWLSAMATITVIMVCVVLTGLYSVHIMPIIDLPDDTSSVGVDGD